MTTANAPKMKMTTNIPAQIHHSGCRRNASWYMRFFDGLASDINKQLSLMLAATILPVVLLTTGASGLQANLLQQKNPTSRSSPTDENGSTLNDTLAFIKTTMVGSKPGYVVRTKDGDVTYQIIYTRLLFNDDPCKGQIYLKRLTNYLPANHSFDNDFVEWFALGELSPGTSVLQEVEGAVVLKLKFGKRQQVSDITTNTFKTRYKDELKIYTKDKETAIRLLRAFEHAATLCVAQK